MAVTSNPTVPRYVNTVVRALLRTPAHRLLSRNTMLLTFTGRRTGRSFTIPVSYCRTGDTLVCYTDSAWWKNLLGGAPVSALVAGRWRAGHADAVQESPEEAVAGLREFLARSPRDARYHGVARGTDGVLDSDDLRRAAGASTRIVIALEAR